MLSCTHPLMMTGMSEQQSLRKSSRLCGTRERLSVAMESCNLLKEDTSASGVWASTNPNDEARIDISCGDQQWGGRSASCSHTLYPNAYSSDFSAGVHKKRMYPTVLSVRSQMTMDSW
jgi:hypothetical protein